MKRLFCIGIVSVMLGCGTTETETCKDIGKIALGYSFTMSKDSVTMHTARLLANKTVRSSGDVEYPLLTNIEIPKGTIYWAFRTEVVRDTLLALVGRYEYYERGKTLSTVLLSGELLELQTMLGDKYNGRFMDGSLRKCNLWLSIDKDAAKIEYLNIDRISEKKQ